MSPRQWLLATLGGALLGTMAWVLLLRAGHDPSTAAMSGVAAAYVGASVLTFLFRRGGRQ